MRSFAILKYFVSLSMHLYVFFGGRGSKIRGKLNELKENLPGRDIQEWDVSRSLNRTKWCKAASSSIRP